ncbi:MAG: penicillin-binding protein, partial [Sphingopyxis sp.]
RAAQIGRPVAGKTGTTSSNKDGWFLGFSSGLTTGVWMGRDDAKAVGGLQGGRAPAKAFADFMRVAVARRPVEAFDTEVKLPEWQLEDEEDAYLGEPGEGGLVDDNGMPIELPYDSRPPANPDGSNPPAPTPEDAPVLDQRWLDEQTGRTDPAPRTPPPPANKALPPAVKSTTVRVPPREGGNPGN